MARKHSKEHKKGSSKKNGEPPALEAAAEAPTPADAEPAEPQPAERQMTERKATEKKSSEKKTSEKKPAEKKMKPAVIIVGADKGGVGKTTIARALLDYLATHQLEARAFDTESPRGTLHRFHPEVTTIVDINSTADQMKILDTLNTAEVKVSVIDVRAGGLTPALQALKDTGFLEAVAEGEVTFLLFHILGSSIASLDEIAEIAPFVSDAHYFLVKNHVNDTTFFDWDPLTHRKYFERVNTAGAIAIPKLNEMSYEQVELAGASFSAFIADRRANGEKAGNSFVLRGYVRTWQGKIAEEFDRVGLLELAAGKAAKPGKSRG
jgi:hypothetical protein